MTVATSGNRRGLRTAAALMLLVALVATSCSSPPKGADGSGDPKVPAPGQSVPEGEPGAFGSPSPSPSKGSTSVASPRETNSLLPTPGGPAPKSGKTYGVTSKEITVVYYWKGDRTRTSPYLKGTGAESNVDEAESFRTWVAYLNKHSDGGATFMGFPFNLHGRKIKGLVVEAGSTPEDQTAAAQKIATEIKPLAAIAAHGSASTYICPYLASKGMFNIATYDLGFDLYKKTNGWCTPAYASFNAQVDAMEHYLSQRVSKTKYDGTDARKFGLLYAEYPGLAAAMKTVVARFERAGIKITSQASISADLAEAQPQAANVVAKFRAAGVNTVFMPEGGSPMSFTPGAEAQGYQPDYVIWPCSGQDTPAQVRLFSAKQWTRATGLTCFDKNFMPDLAMDTEAQQTEWYAKYHATNSAEPPAQAPLVYSALLPFVAAVTNAGPDLTSDSFRAAFSKFDSYRYSAATGRTSDGRSMLLSSGDGEHPLIGDFTVLRWSATARRNGSAFTGAYVFPEDGRRYGRRDAFN